MYDKEEDYISELSVDTICARFSNYTKIPIVFINMDDVLRLFPMIFTMNEPEYVISIEDRSEPILLTMQQLCLLDIKGIPLQELLQYAEHAEVTYNLDHAKIR